MYFLQVSPSPNISTQPPVYSTFTPLLSRFKIEYIVAIQHLEFSNCPGGIAQILDIQQLKFSNSNTETLYEQNM